MVSNLISYPTFCLSILNELLVSVFMFTENFPAEYITTQEVNYTVKKTDWWDHLTLVFKYLQ